MSNGSESDHTDEDKEVQVIFTTDLDDSSVEPPRSEWSSLFETVQHYDNPKRYLHSQGLYTPGSGEICTKYFAQSASSVFRHVYYKYPPVTDPGIYKALLNPQEVVIYPNDGQELYLAMCKEMNQCPVRKFLKGLLEKEIDLRYYCVNPAGIRAMASALRYNKIVTKLVLTENYLSEDACYHLGEMLSDNSSLNELILTGCRIGPFGAKRLLHGLKTNRVLKTLILDKNEIQDEGGEIFAQAVFVGMGVEHIGLSYNKLGPKTALTLSEALETHNNFTHIDLSWNNLYVNSPGPVSTLLTLLSGNPNLKYIDLSWNNLSDSKIAIGIRKILVSCQQMTHVILRNNKLKGFGVTKLLRGLPKAKKLQVLDLSFNPLTPADAIKLVSYMKNVQVKLKNLLLDNVPVDEYFIRLRNNILRLKFRAETVITYGEVLTKCVPKPVDVRAVILRRADAIARKAKKNKVDIALFCQQLVKDGNEMMNATEFAYALKKGGCNLDDDLMAMIVETFLAFRTAKARFMNMLALVDYMKRLWPERKLPPTPPPEPEIIAPPPKEKGKKK